MSTTSIEYIFENRDAIIESLNIAGKIIMEDVTINLDILGIPQTCYFIVDDIPEQLNDSVEI